MEHLLLFTHDVLVVNCLCRSTTRADPKLLHYLKIPTDLGNSHHLDPRSLEITCHALS